MPPKSSSKKVGITWFYCESCNTYITSKDRDNHESHCPIAIDESEIQLNLDFIKSEALYTTKFEKSKSCTDLLDLSPKHLNNLIFMSEDAMRLCKLFIGQHVAICFPQRQYVSPIVRRIWSIPDKFLSTIHFSDDDFDEVWKEYRGTQIKIEKLFKDPKPAKEVYLKVNGKLAVETDAIADIANLLKHQMKDLVFCIGNRICLNFYNKELEFSISGFKSCFKETEDSLENAFNKLHITTEFFTVLHNSNILIENSVNNINTETNAQDAFKTVKSSIGGLNEQIQQIEELMNIGLGIQNIPTGLKISRGMLLFGPTGNGKTMVCEALANETQTEVIRINTSEIFSKFFGETEKKLQNYFDTAYNNYPKSTLIIIENIHNICPKHESNEVVKRVSVAFMNIIDNLHYKREGSRIFILATTSNIENLNSAIRRCGRLDTEVEISAPSPSVRYEILQKLLENVDHELTDADIADVGNVTHGYVGSDLVSLMYNAALKALNDKRVKLLSNDVNYAMNYVKPSAMREVLIESPNIKWEDIGGQADLKLKLKQAIDWPLLYPDKFKKLGITRPRGILMFGPPGCSKTMIAKALATESKVNFLSIKGPELFSMWVGESERAVRELFRKARQVAPSIIFFDEIDAIGGERSSDSSSSVKERVLAQLLTELDGVDVLRNVTVVAATNRPDMCDKALLRPGRIDRIVYVGLPDQNTRKEIFKIKLQKMPLANDVNLDRLVALTEGYSGAEIQAVCHEAALKTLEESFDLNEVAWQHFESALKFLPPRTSPELLKLYENYMKQR